MILWKLVHNTGVTLGDRQIDSDKRNIASEDKSNYKVVKKGDIPYNSMRMWQGAVGNSEYDGIVSPAYTVLTPTSDANGKFFIELFKKESTLQIFQRWSQGLTSDTWNLKYPVLSSIQFDIPSVEEQTEIARYFSTLDSLITLHQRKLEKLQNMKKSCLSDIIFNEEKDFEEAVIKALIEHGWESDVIRYPSEEDLIQNWANILFNNNKQGTRLNDQPLTSGEMAQILDQVRNLQSPMALNEFINGRTLGDGIRDKNVLGFDPYMVRIYDDADIREKVALSKAKAKDQADAFSDPKKEKVYLKYMDSSQIKMYGELVNGKYVKGIEDFVPNEQYQTDEYVDGVIQDIKKKWTLYSRNRKFHAIFATSSIPEAVKYYRLMVKAFPDLFITAMFDPN